MRIAASDPGAARMAVIDRDTEQELARVVWADDEAGVYVQCDAASGRPEVKRGRIELIRKIVAGAHAAGTDRGPWFYTFSGRRFHLLDPSSAEIQLNDIVWALSNMCRYNGHCMGFYSVAQHSVLVSRLVPDELALTALMHDAAEAYTGDMTRPMKAAFPAFKDVEEPIERALAERYLLTYPWPAEVKHADLVALATEKRDLLASGTWDIALPEPHPEIIIPWSPGSARQRFVARFNELTGGAA